GRRSMMVGGASPGMSSSPGRAQAGAAAMGGGGGGAVDDSEEQEARVAIAGMSATLATIDKNPKSLAVVKKLDDPAALHFAEGTLLEEALRKIQEASKGTDGKRIPIYLDPAGLQEADKNLSSPVMLDLEDVPLKFSLRLILKQLGLAYCVRDGVVI